MNTAKQALMLVVGCATFTIPAAAQQITLDGFFTLVQQQHPLFQKEVVSKAIEVQGRDAYLGSKDWRVSSSPTYIHQSPLATSTFSPERLDQFRTGATLEKAFWSTGGRLAVSWTSDLTDQKLDDIIIPFGTEPVVISPGPPRFYQNNLSLTYSQPLFQNFRGELDRLGYESAQYAVHVADLQAQENQEAFLLEMGIRFLDWVLLTEQKIIAGEQLELTQQQLEQTERKRAANLIDEVDVLRSEDAVRIAEQNTVLFDAQCRAKQAELAVLSRSPEIYSTTPAFDLYQRLDPLTLEQATNRLEQYSRLLRVLSTRNQLLGRQHKGLKELTKPQLFVSTQLTAKSGDNDLGNSFGFNKSDAGIFLQFNYPLGNRSALADLEKSRLQLRRFDLEMDEITLSLEAGLRNLIIQMEGMEKVLLLNEKQIESARLKTEEERKRYEQGRGDLAFVIQSQDNEERARMAYAQNAAAYHSLNLRLKALIDELLVTEY